MNKHSHSQIFIEHLLCVRPGPGLGDTTETTQARCCSFGVYVLVEGDKQPANKQGNDRHDKFSKDELKRDIVGRPF